MDYSLQLITEPAAEPVTTTEAKAHLNVEHTADDAMIAVFITAARKHVEARTNRALVRQKWRVKHNYFSDCMELGKGPVISVDSVSYVDTDGTTQVVGATESPNNPGDYYELDKPRELIRKVYGASWPSARWQADAITIDFYAGYTDTTVSPNVRVPADLRAAILLLVGHLYEHRESQGDLETYRNPAFDLLIGSHWMPK